MRGSNRQTLTYCTQKGLFFQSAPLLSLSKRRKMYIPLAMLVELAFRVYGDNNGKPSK